MPSRRGYCAQLSGLPVIPLLRQAARNDCPRIARLPAHPASATTATKRLDLHSTRLPYCCKLFCQPRCFAAVVKPLRNRTESSQRHGGIPRKNRNQRCRSSDFPSRPAIPRIWGRVLRVISGAHVERLVIQDPYCGAHSGRLIQFLETLKAMAQTLERIEVHCSELRPGDRDSLRRFERQKRRETSIYTPSPNCQFNPLCQSNKRVIVLRTFFREVCPT